MYEINQLIFSQSAGQAGGHQGDRTLGCALDLGIGYSDELIVRVTQDGGHVGLALESPSNCGVVATG